MGVDYKAAGVDVEAGYEAVRLMKEHVRTTFNENVLGDLGSFGGFYSIANEKLSEPVLVAGTDGVGTKLKIAFLMDKHDTVGIDCVAMCVNDVVCQGAKPLFFLDYIATGKLVPGRVADIVKGVSDGCRQAGCALIGGETAEMPGFYPENEYDLAGFAVGIVDRARSINGSSIRPGDVLIGLTSSGLHSNGFSLVRRLLGEEKEFYHKYNYDLGMTWGEEVLRPTAIYVRTIQELMKTHTLKGIAHITGGGFIENIPRILPAGARAKIELGSWPVLTIFHILQHKGEIPLQSLYNTFNMGIGMVIAVSPDDVSDIVRECVRVHGQEAYVIGEVVEGEPGVDLVG